VLQIAAQIDHEILDIDLDFVNFKNGDFSSEIDEKDFSFDNIERFLIANNESEGEFNNEEGEILIGGEEGIEENNGGVVVGNGSVIVTNADDCIPVVIRNYQEYQEEVPEENEFACEVIDGLQVCVGGASIVILNCQSIKRCSSVLVPRVGFNCMCKEEVMCVQLT